MRTHRRLASAAVVVAGLVAAAPATAAPQVDTSALRAAVTYDGLHDHLEALQAAAVVDAESGAPTRATGTPGHRNSVAYIERKLLDAGYGVTEQPFKADIFVEQFAAFSNNRFP